MLSAPQTFSSEVLKAGLCTFLKCLFDKIRPEVNMFKSIIGFTCIKCEADYIFFLNVVNIYVYFCFVLVLSSQSLVSSLK